LAIDPGATAMKIMTCPVNGARPVSEFTYWGEMRTIPDPQTSTDDEWADYVFCRNGAAGIKKEWWCHTSSNTWFIVERDTAKDRVIRTYLNGEEA
jgi:sarcosine oxidase subunit delta